jgi:hypothetical protein
MTLDSAEWKKLAAPLAGAILLVAAGAWLIWYERANHLAETRALAAARADRVKASDRLSKTAEEEREVREKSEVYGRLKSLGIVGEEKRLEWVDAMARIRASRELADLKYTVERQKSILSAPAKPNGVDLFASTMKVELALLHEGDLLGFLADLRQAGNAYYAVRRCDLLRTGVAPQAATLGPRVRATCHVDLITIHDRGAKS